MRKLDSVNTIAVELSAMIRTALMSEVSRLQQQIPEAEIPR